MSDGMCEVDSETPCAWVRIYTRQKTLDNLDEMKNIIEPKNWSAGAKPGRLTTRKDKGKDKKKS